MTALAGWQNFYVIVGSSAGALIGLQFVVLTLISQRPITGPGLAQGSAIFSTPTIVHFGTVLLLSGLLNAPWNSVHAAAVLWGLVGLGGLVYSTRVGSRMRRQTVYQPVFEDWLFHAWLPMMSYAALAVSACAVKFYPSDALFALAAAAMLLLFVGIHNAWDAVTYHVFHRRPPEKDAAIRGSAGTEE
jgi:hypothetical protein